MPEQINPIYSGKPEDFRWAGFGSGSGTNLRECAKVIPPALIFCDKPSAKLLQLEELADTPKIFMDGLEACGKWKEAIGNPLKEAEYQRRSLDYNHKILQALHEFEENEGPIHLIVLGGYMRLVGQPILDAYHDRIINVHPADLSVLLNGKRRLIGENAVYDALYQGFEATRSSVIMVDRGVDHGEILTMGPSVRTWEGFVDGSDAEREECIKKYAEAHQSFQKVRSDWPALTTALTFISWGRFALGTEKKHHGEWRTVYLDGNPLGYGGFRINNISSQRK